MALTDTDKIKLELGLNSFENEFFTPEEYQYFLDKNNGSIRRASLDVAKTLLFQLSQLVREQSGPELALYNNQWFEQYMKVLQMYIADPNYSIAIQGAMPYAGGISRSDIQDNLDTLDNNAVLIEKGIPVEYYGLNTNNTSAFSDADYNTGGKYPNSPFNV